MFSFILALCLSGDPTDFNKAKTLAINEEYEDALVMLEKIDPRSFENQGQYFYFRGLCEFFLYQKKAACKHLEYVEESFDEIPERYRVSAYLMLEDMKTWKEDDLGNVSRKMNRIRWRLDQAKGGAETRKLQKEVLKDLDRLIQQKEDEKKQAQEKAEQAQESGESKPEQGNDPLKDSQIVNGIASGQIDAKKMEVIAKNWGTLPEKERVKALLDLTKDIPEKYRAAIENYLKTISNKSGNK